MESSPIIFMDIDGVLNDHTWNEDADCCTTSEYCVGIFNDIIHIYKPRIVITSAWRYMIINGYMSYKGFEILLRTHGVSKEINLIGCTVADELIPSRGKQITHFIRHNYYDAHPYLVIDDLDLDITSEHHPFIKVRGDRGLHNDDYKCIQKELESMLAEQPS